MTYISHLHTLVCGLSYSMHCYDRISCVTLVPLLLHTRREASELLLHCGMVTPSTCVLDAEACSQYGAVLPYECRCPTCCGSSKVLLTCSRAASRRTAGDTASVAAPPGTGSSALGRPRLGRSFNPAPLHSRSTSVRADVLRVGQRRMRGCRDQLARTVRQTRPGHLWSSAYCTYEVDSITG